jgi:lipopolysaccharide export LptBFGC system permease protein LptF
MINRGLLMEDFNKKLIEARNNYYMSDDDYEAFNKMSHIEEQHVKAYSLYCYKKGFENDYEWASFRERVFFEDFYKGKYKIYITPFYSNEPYDVMLYEVRDNKIINRIYIEIKIRDKSWDEYIFEKDKYNRLTKRCKNGKILYLNFTPKGTYIWNTNVVKNLNTTTSLMNKATMKNRDNKIEKEVWYLSTEYAKKSNYINEK